MSTYIAGCVVQMIELSPPEFYKAEGLFADLVDLHLFATAVFNHDEPGRIYVDNPEQPTSGFMSTKELQFLAGDPDNQPFNRELKQRLHETICVGDAPGEKIEEIDLTFIGDSWQHQLEFFFGDWRWPPIPSRAAHYLWQKDQLEWRVMIPIGYTIQPLDARKIQAQPANGMPYAIKPFAEFGQDGFGFCAIYNGRIVSSCFCDVISKPGCEIGVETHPDHRRRGLATIVTAATVGYALEAGFTDIWWICDVHNTGSIGTAVKTGFTEQFQTESTFFILDEAEHRRQTNEHK
ncbi:MAG: GNAT family N-acetyltransferase [Anaerolineae bacterium]|nr:GNAT family N-acetyltransferase [Anaerolineae bacterium]